MLRVGRLSLSLVLLWAGPLHAAESNPVVARVNEHEIRLSQVYESIESLPLGDQIDARGELNTYIEALINEEVLFQYALSRISEGDAQLRARIKELVVDFLIETHVRSRIQVTDAEVQAFYDANPSQVRGEHVRVRKILLRAREECERMMRQIDSEQTFITLAKAHSLDRKTAASGGDSGLLMRPERRGNAYARARERGYELEYFDMTPGEMRVFDVPGGCLLVRQVYYVRPPLPALAAVQESIRRYLMKVKETRLIEELFANASKPISVERLYRSR